MAKKHARIPSFSVGSKIFTAALLLSSTAAYAQTATIDPASPMSPASVAAPPVPIAPNHTSDKDLDTAFSHADANQDGQLSQEEVKRYPALAQQFERIDVNRDSFISRDEFNKAANS